ncbi:MAG: hypothetical protein LJE91_13370 [Gammaproteobacteria bacterium]|jgi:hypothetical protein|nr:hypothetical protein [Gammaproteobacteria bacterium]
MQRAHDEAPPAPKPRRNTWIAVAALLVLVVVGVTVPWVSRFGGPENLIDEIAAEVVENHLHNKPLEVDTTRIAGIQECFTRLDFMPVESRYLADRGLTLLGGRYCSLQGVTAAQLRFAAVGEDELYTLYEFGYDPKVFHRTRTTTRERRRSRPGRAGSRSHSGSRRVFFSRSPKNRISDR